MIGGTNYLGLFSKRYGEVEQVSVLARQHTDIPPPSARRYEGQWPTAGLINICDRVPTRHVQSHHPLLEGSLLTTCESV